MKKLPEIIRIDCPYRREWKIQIDDNKVGTITEEPHGWGYIYHVYDKSYIGRALGQQRWFDDLVGIEGATFANIDDAKKFIDKQLENYPKSPK